MKEQAVNIVNIIEIRSHLLNKNKKTITAKINRTGPRRTGTGNVAINKTNTFNKPERI